MIKVQTKKCQELYAVDIPKEDMTMNKVILTTILMTSITPVMAQVQTWDPRYSPSPVSNPVVHPVYTQPVYGGYGTSPYYPSYGPDVSNPVITRSEYPGALDPQRNLPSWVYNP